MFPSDLAETGMDVIKFTMLEFKPRKITKGLVDLVRFRKEKKEEKVLAQ